MESNFQIHVLPQFRQLKYIVNDFSDITGHAIDLDHLGAYAVSDQIIANTKAQLRIAMVVDKPEYLELARHYCTLMEQTRFECAIFTTRAEAMAWGQR